ncbi:MAG: methionyl-tRNA formyltransferase [Longimicrobiales bacterium]
MKILFWGTPEFALPGLRALLGEGHEVVGVVTQPDRRAGRGQQFRASAIKTLALEEQIPVLQPERARGAEFLAQVRELAPDLSVVIAYGQILKRDVLEFPPLGSINVHASLLPELRGAAPINWAIMRGHTETGVTIMRMVEALDAGPMLLQIVEPIADDESASDLWTRLSELGAAALVEALALIEAGAQEERAQDEARATYAPRITKTDAHIDWSKRASELDRMVRGLDETPGAWSMLGQRTIKLFRPLVDEDPAPAAEPGTVLEVQENDDARGFRVACGAGALWIREVIPAGKARMKATAWARGRGVAAGHRFT